MPATWRGNRPQRPQVTATVGGRPPSGLGKDALLDFRVELTLDGERLTAAEVKALLAVSNGLRFIRGRWVEVDRERLGRMLGEFREVEAPRQRRGCGSPRRCGCSRARTSPPRTPRHRRGRVVARRRRSLARRDPRGTAPPEGWRTSIPARRSGDPAAVPAGRRPLAAPVVRARPRRLPRRRHGPRQDDPGPGAPAGSPRTRLERGAATEPARGPGVAARQLGRRRSSASPRACRRDRASVGDAGRGTQGVARAPARGRRSRDHELRLAAAHPVAARARLAPRDSRRGAGDQESAREADARGQAARARRRASR